jgi:hypothetical protein
MQKSSFPVRGASLAVAVFACAAILFACASTGSAPSSRSQAQPEQPGTPVPPRPERADLPQPESAARTTTAPAEQQRRIEQPAVETVPQTTLNAAAGQVHFDIADIAGRRLPARIDIRDASDRRLKTVEAPAGTASADLPAGTWKTYVSVIDDGVPVMIHAQTVQVQPNASLPVAVRLLEGVSGNRKLREFDRDFDLAIDRVELEAGTDPNDAASTPGDNAIAWPSPVLSTKGQWYVGDLHTHSRYGIGKESVGELVRRAERSGLDFIAITDRNTMQSAFDPEFTSKSVVLIPGMEWGNDASGVGLIYAPRTMPEPPSTFGAAQALVYRVQAQGGLFFIAHPCFATGPWQWGLSYVNGVETWCRDWNVPPPLWLGRLNNAMKVRKEGGLIHSIALAAATQGYSANGQAAWFYDSELTRGLKAAMIGGSYSVGPEVPLGRPLTYVFANEKSLNGILDGLRWGRSFVTSGKDGPKIALMADVLRDDTIDAGIGGYVPLNVPVTFRVEVQDAPAGSTLEVLLNGSVFRSMKVDSPNFAWGFNDVPENYATFRARIVVGSNPGEFGVTEVLAMTSPIYALEVIPDMPGADDNIWLAIEHQLYRPGTSDKFQPGNPATDEYRTLSPWRR